MRIARKHLGWYIKHVEKCDQDGRSSAAQGSASNEPRPENAAFRAIVNRAETAAEQQRLTRDYFDALAAQAAGEFAAAA